MSSIARRTSFLIAAGLVGLSAWTWAGCSGATPAASDAEDAAADAPASPPRALDAGTDVDLADADAAPFVMAPHRAWPALEPHTGRLLEPMTLVTIVATNDVLAGSLFSFSDALVASAWWKAVGAEYGLGAIAASVHVTAPAITTSPNRAAIIQYVQDAIDGAAAPMPNGKTLYLVYLPTGLTITGSTFAAFHGVFPAVDAGAGDGFAVVSHQAPAVGESQLDQLTKVASHEIIEAATDPGLESWRLATQTATPWTGSVWSAQQAGHIENGDLCDGNRIREPLANGFLYQRSWSVARATAAGDPCVPVRAAVYNNVSVPQDWYPGSAGQVVKIPFTGWSTAATTNWLMSVSLSNSTTALADLKLGTGTGLSISTALGNGTAASCFSRQAMNNGATGTLSVTLPASAQSGDFAVLSLNSFREAASCNQAPEDDLRHPWLVGVYVP